MTILVAEDDRSVMKILIKEIKRIAPDAELLTAINGQGALGVAEGKRIDLLVTDHGMGPGNGIFLSQELRKRNPDVTIFMMSGSSYLELYIKEARAHRGFDKPGDMDDLFVAIENFVQSVQK